MTDRIPWRRPLTLVGLLAWLVPGLGHLVVGRPRRAVVMLVAIGALFAGGLALTAYTCVNTERYSLEFAAQIFAGGPALLTLTLTRGFEVTSFLPHFEVGRLYVDVAGLLNIVAISDALGLALAHNARVGALEQLARGRRARAAAEPDGDTPTLEAADPGPLTGDRAGPVDEALPPLETDVFPAFGWDAPDPEEGAS